MRTLTTEQQIMNCRVAIEMVMTLQDHQFMPSLRQYANLQLIEGGPTDPGAVGCMGGWSAQNPHFAQYGVYACPEDGAPLQAETLFPSEVSTMLFGVDSIFAQVQPHEVALTPKQVCLERLRVALETLLGKT